LQNNIGELWSQFNFLMPSLLGPWDDFNKNFANPIEKHSDAHRLSQLTTRLRPFMLRRTKDVVAQELPPVTEIIQTIRLQGGQRDLYESVRVAADTKVQQTVKKMGLSRSAIVILDALLKLRQVCCDPGLVKLTEAQKVKQSAKLSHLLDLVEELKAEGRRILIFSQFTSMLAIISRALDKKNIAHQELTGKTTQSARQARVDAFNEGALSVFLISLKAGGTGLNLVGADTVIHYDPWWNPAVEQQATDRVHRIGQQKKVFVYKLVVEGSVEERILELQKKKRLLANALVGDGKLSQLLEADDLHRLFAPLSAGL
jgi:SNF2 family DNA or RNA helicase